MTEIGFYSVFIALFLSAYVELGWGGYWAWDPVENASFMPWIGGIVMAFGTLIVMLPNRQQRSRAAPEVKLAEAT